MAKHGHILIFVYILLIGIFTLVSSENVCTKHHSETCCRHSSTKTIGFFLCLVAFQCLLAILSLHLPLRQKTGTNNTSNSIFELKIFLDEIFLAKNLKLKSHSKTDSKSEQYRMKLLTLCYFLLSVLTIATHSRNSVKNRFSFPKIIRSIFTTHD